MEGRNPPVKRKKVSCGSDQDYGLLEEEYPLAMDDDEHLVKHMKSFLNYLSLTEVQRNQLDRDTVEQSRTKAMQYGIDSEPFAKAMLQLQMNIDVTNCGLFMDKDQPFLAANPDCLVGDDEIVEIKCPMNISDSESLSSLQRVESSYRDLRCLDCLGTNLVPVFKLRLANLSTTNCRMLGNADRVQEEELGF
uniref:YqaJ viral recombinase domain-containing protein n=1 Tax=Timema poppense TaxID=170557 RepID=A0A7R9DTD0_TIMPO|nr:unnamed protein product [Timema poppensis]